MKPEDMHDKMETMMSQMFSGMSAEERVQFCSTMMPKCLSKVFAGVGPEQKDNSEKLGALDYECAICGHKQKGAIQTQNLDVKDKASANLKKAKKQNKKQNQKQK